MDTWARRHSLLLFFLTETSIYVGVWEGQTDECPFYSVTLYKDQASKHTCDSPDAFISSSHTISMCSSRCVTKYVRGIGVHISVWIENSDLVWIENSIKIRSSVTGTAFGLQNFKFWIRFKLI